MSKYCLRTGAERSSVILVRGALILLLEQTWIELMLVQLGQVRGQRLYGSKLRGQLSRQCLQRHRLHHEWREDGQLHGHGNWVSGARTAGRGNCAVK